MNQWIETDNDTENDTFENIPLLLQSIFNFTNLPNTCTSSRRRAHFYDFVYIPGHNLNMQYALWNGKKICITNAAEANRNQVRTKRDVTNRSCGRIALHVLNFTFQLFPLICQSDQIFQNNSCGLWWWQTCGGCCAFGISWTRYVRLVETNCFSVN